jgi:ferredoxin--NADP+ reductase
LDVARVLLRPFDDLVRTDVPAPVLRWLRKNRTRRVHLIGRRGPEYCKFSTKELRELAGVAGVDRVVVGEVPADMPDDRFDRRVRSTLTLLQKWSEEGRGGHGKSVEFRFGFRPVAIRGVDSVESLVLERTQTTPDGGVTGTSDFEVLPVQLVVRSIGYRSTALPGVPFDESAGVVPNDHGKVTGLDGRPCDREYVTGWLKRGPTGVIGTNKVDSQETVSLLVRDLEQAPVCSLGDIEDRLRLRGTDWFCYADWQAIDEEEQQRGAREGRPRSKISDWPTLFEVGRHGVPRQNKARSETQ